MTAPFTQGSLDAADDSLLLSSATVGVDVHIDLLSSHIGISIAGRCGLVPYKKKERKPFLCGDNWYLRMVSKCTVPGPWRRKRQYKT